MFNISQLTSRTKLIIGFSVIVVFTLLMIVVSYISIVKINKNQHELGEWMTITQRMTHLRAEGNLLRTYMLEAQIFLIDGKEVDNMDKITTISDGIFAEFIEIKNDLSNVKDFAVHFLEINEGFNVFMDNNQRQLSMLKTNDLDGFYTLAAEQYKLFNRLREDFAAMEEQMLEQSDVLHQSSSQIVRRSVSTSLVVGLLVVLVIVIIVIGTFRMLKRILREMNQAVEILGTSSAEIETTITEISTGAAETATAISETSATIEEIRQTSMLANEKAKSMIDDASHASEAAYQGLVSSEKMVLSIAEIDQQMQQINLTIQKLAVQSNSIGEITSTVSDIADQSNLLAVNAAIEAAKAGELGRGFGVVAKEIRSLAEQSKKSTAQVKDILEQMREQILNAVDMIKKGSLAVESGSRIVLEDKEIVHILSENIEATNQASLQISSTSQQQMAGMDQIVPAMNNIKMASEQNVAAIRQVQQASADLNELGRKIQKILNRYKI